MGEYSWNVRQIWFGVEGPEPGLHNLGIIRRSGRVRQLGHFCHVKINVNGEKVWASGAEDRIYMLHLVQWKDIGETIPRGMIPALGWDKSGNRYAYANLDFFPVYADMEGTLKYVPDKEFNPEWLFNGVPTSLIKRGALFMTNHYYALMGEDGKPRVTLPIKGTTIDQDGVISGLTGAVGMWNGTPKPWCKEIIEVKSENWWSLVKDDEKKVIWKRKEDINGDIQQL